MPTSSILARALCSWAHGPVQKPDCNEKKNILEGSLSGISLKTPLFTKATLCWEDMGAVEDIQVDINTAGHLPKTVLHVVSNAE